MDFFERIIILDQTSIIIIDDDNKQKDCWTINTESKTHLDYNRGTRYELMKCVVIGFCLSKAINNNRYVSGTNKFWKGNEKKNKTLRIKLEIRIYEWIFELLSNRCCLIYENINKYIDHSSRRDATNLKQSRFTVGNEHLFMKMD